MFDFINKEEMGLNVLNLNPQNPSHYLPSKVKKTASGTLTNKNGDILCNGIPIDGIQGAVIIDGNIFAISDEMREKWELNSTDSGNFYFEVYNGRDSLCFSSRQEDNMQIFLNYGFCGREVLVVLDTRINRQGCIVSKGPKFADQIETVFATLIQYYIAAEEQSSSVNDDKALSSPPAELLETQEATYDEGDFNNERFL